MVRTYTGSQLSEESHTIFIKDVVCAQAVVSTIGSASHELTASRHDRDMEIELHAKILPHILCARVIDKRTPATHVPSRACSHGGFLHTILHSSPILFQPYDIHEATRNMRVFPTFVLQEVGIILLER